jgi:hypothetical protein
LTCCSLSLLAVSFWPLALGFLVFGALLGADDECLVTVLDCAQSTFSQNLRVWGTGSDCKFLIRVLLWDYTISVLGGGKSF